LFKARCGLSSVAGTLSDDGFERVNAHL
jgi:hypothetical protein